MQRYKALLETTWWLWLVFVAGGIALTRFVASEFLIMFPLFAVIFVYFAFVRFDENGNRREGGQ
jgi:hypothetical protein